MIVTYVKPSEDAAIAGTYKDLKITNNYGTPIYVEGYTSGKTLTFTIYGKETRPANRTFKFVSETLGTNRLRRRQHLRRFLHRIRCPRRSPEVLMKLRCSDGSYA